MPADIELFSMSAGGVLEPKADWTETATRHLKAAFIKRKEKLGLRTVELAEKDADELHEVNTLHAAVARAIDMHHFGPLPLPTKEGKLDWSLAEAVAPVKKASGADYALFSWIRDSYASAERKAAMIGLALLGGGPLGRHPGRLRLARRPEYRAGGVVQPHGARPRRPARSRARGRDGGRAAHGVSRGAVNRGRDVPRRRLRRLRGARRGLARAQDAATGRCPRASRGPIRRATRAASGR